MSVDDLIFLGAMFLVGSFTIAVLVGKFIKAGSRGG